MLNQAVVEALYSATYVQDYLDCIDNLPSDLQRHLSRLRELDASCQIYLRDIDQQQEELDKTGINHSVRTQALKKLKQALMCAQEIGDEKLQIVQTVQDFIENKTKQLDLDFRNLDFGRDQENNDPAKETSANNGSLHTSCAPIALTEKGKRARRARTESMTDSGQDVLSSDTRSSAAAGTSNGNQKRAGNTGNNQGKKKKRKTRQGNQARDDTPLPPEDDPAIDPNEPTYCLCDQISYGEMIMCDNDLCPIEWFHFSCVQLSTKPKGKWFCPKCRGDRPNIMKPKAQFLKELALYNKEKEEKSSR